MHDWRLLLLQCDSETHLIILLGEYEQAPHQLQMSICNNLVFAIYHTKVNGAWHEECILGGLRCAEAKSEEQQTRP